MCSFFFRYVWENTFGHNLRAQISELDLAILLNEWTTSPRSKSIVFRQMGEEWYEFRFFLLIYWKYSQNKDRLHDQNKIIYQQRGKYWRETAFQSWFDHLIGYWMLEIISQSSFSPSLAKTFTQIKHLVSYKKGLCIPYYSLDSYLDPPCSSSNIIDDQLSLIASVANCEKCGALVALFITSYNKC